MVTSLDPPISAVPLDGSVTTIKLADNSVTDPKIATQESTKITGLPVQTKSQDQGGFELDEASVLGLNGIPTPGTTGSVSLGKLFLDTSGENHLSIRKNSDPIDIENPALGISIGENSITASTTQTQGEGQLTEVVNEVSIVANNDDTVTLPTAVSFLTVIVMNNGAKKLQVFPSSGDDLGNGIDQSTTILAGSSVHFVCFDVTTWKMI